jgi:hypothetical protein
VEPAGLAVQSAQIGSAPFNPLQYETFNETTSAASDLASYVLALNSQNTPTPFMLRTDTTRGSGVLALARMPSINDTFYPNITSGGTYRSIIGAPVRITFRGSTVLCALKGTSVSFYPDRASVTLYISPFEYSLQLDSAIFGVLDTNRLGL